MARLNLEEKLWTDVRFKKLIKKLGEATAIGEWVLVAFEAQKHWAKGKQPIPDDDWAFGEYNEELINCRLVRKVEGGYHLCGSEEHFDWYLRMLEFGKRGVESRKMKKEISDKNNSPVDCTVNSPVDCTVNSPVDCTVNPLTLTLTLAPSKKNIYIGPEGFKAILPEIDDYALPTAARITESQLRTALDKWGAADVKDYIERIHNHIEATGKRYKSIGAVLMNWLKRRDDWSESNGNANGSDYSKAKISNNRGNGDSEDPFIFTLLERAKRS